MVMFNAEAVQRAARKHEDDWSTRSDDMGGLTRVGNAYYHGALDQSIVDETLAQRGEISDGHHTHNELYAYRLAYNAALFNEWARHGSHLVVKSWNHCDGEPVFDGNWFIVVAELPTGQISNHYQAVHWSKFVIPDLITPPEYDGHTPAQALDRLLRYIEGEEAP